MKAEVFCSDAYRKIRKPVVFYCVRGAPEVHRTSFYLGIQRLSRLVIKRFVLSSALSHSICAVIIAAW